MFIDKARIYLRGGTGGNGCISFHREKFVPYGGPDGGNGGNGGDIYLEGDNNLYTLNDFVYQPHYCAKNGLHGSSNNRQGKSGENMIIKVPCGTVVYKNGSIIADIKSHGERVKVASGGRGGRGNAAFKSQQNTVPRIAEKGEPGEEVVLDLELRLIADVGIIGCPNAGKSTLLSKITSARPKIADYPFTTTSPNIGVAEYKGRRFVLADIPGLIEDAHIGKGLGDEFLRHITRNRLLIHLIDVFGYDGKTAYENYCIVKKELQLYSKELAKKPVIIVCNKIDLSGAEKALRILKHKLRNKRVFAISSVTGKGLHKLLDEIIKILSKMPPEEYKDKVPAVIQYIFEPLFTISKQGGTYVVKSKEIERIVAMTDFRQPEAVIRLQALLKKYGLEKALKKYNICAGDIVSIGKYKFTWQ